MTRALVSVATGAYRQLFDVSRPTMERYADRHGYELFLPVKDTLARARAFERPPAWWKIPLMKAALTSHEEALWLDADVVVADDTWDIADDVPDDAWQALVRHQTPDGEVPNCGVWLVRRPMQSFLSRIWAMTEYLHHRWWEQAALMQLLGYQLEPARRTVATRLYRHTHWLGLEWNSHESMDRHPTPRFAHATVGPTGWRLEVMRRYARQDAPIIGG